MVELKNDEQRGRNRTPRLSAAHQRLVMGGTLN
jgi:hypothetical protein